MAAGSDSWGLVAREICASLGEGLDVVGVIESADVYMRVGGTCLEVVVEASDIEGPLQGDAYRVLCDLLETRLTGIADEAVGFLLLATEPSPEAFAVGMDQMRRPSGAFVPVLPLGRAKATDMAGATARFVDIADDAIALLGAATGKPPHTIEDARSFLTAFDELIDRECRRQSGPS
ncbi:MAG: hypothetical protein OEV40_27065 [Acidimicrobiia bacterium]|nr:hypothetical protein [Acidimicrobiia bacterium]